MDLWIDVRVEACLKGDTSENAHISRAITAFIHHLQISCTGDHTQLNSRGKGRCASAAQYPREECRRIMMEGICSTDTSEGGRIPPSQAKPWDVFQSWFVQKVIQ